MKSEKIRVGEKRIWRGNGPARVMAVADGWVMARRPHAIPFTVRADDWVCLPLADAVKIEVLP